MVGNGVKIDGFESFKWLKLSAEQGNSQAYTDLGYCYANSIGTKKICKKLLIGI